jgi:preprotein translocase subunit SecG
MVFAARAAKAKFPDMVILLVVVHVIVCLFLIGVVLLQQGKSADLAGAFGGQGSQTAFGPRGAANLLTRLTTYSAILFMLTSIGLTVVLSHSSAHIGRCCRMCRHRSRYQRRSSEHRLR